MLFIYELFKNTVSSSKLYGVICFKKASHRVGYKESHKVSQHTANQHQATLQKSEDFNNTTPERVL
jgi:hypothetical protein